MDTKAEATATIFYSAKDCGFVFLAERAAYDEAGTWPSDAVEVTEDELQRYGQQPPPPGMRRGSDPEGRPAWVTPEVSPEQAKIYERVWRDRQLNGTDALVTRHRDELEAARPTTLSADQYQQLQRYRLDLRDWPNAELFPNACNRPAPPNWLSDSTE